MTDESRAPASLMERLARLLPEREFFVRSERGLRRVRISTLQQTMAAGALGALFLLSAGSVSYIALEGRIFPPTPAEQAQALSRTQAAQIETLRAQIAALTRTHQTMTADLLTARTAAQAAQLEQRRDRTAAASQQTMAQAMARAESRITAIREAAAAKALADVAEREAETLAALEDMAAESRRLQGLLAERDATLASLGTEKNRLVERLASAEARAASAATVAMAAAQADLAGTIARIETERDELAVARDTLASTLDTIRADHVAQSNRIRTLMADLGRTRAHAGALEDRLAQVDSARITAEGLLADLGTSFDRERRTRADLESVLGRLTASIDARFAAERGATDGIDPEELARRVSLMATAQETLIDELERAATGNLSVYEDIVETAGLKVRDLIDAMGEQEEGVGGPFVDVGGLETLRASVEGDSEADGRLDRLATSLSQLNGLHVALRSLPLATPVDEFRQTSRYGVRKDPMTRRKAMHTGLDFAGPVGTTIHATAPGQVIYAGRKGAYGNFVEIDHGNGITTRYAHLSEITVEVGDTVGFRERIGKMGSSGRSTGSHLHYEIRFKGQFKDPARFIKAGRYVFKNEERADAG